MSVTIATMHSIQWRVYIYIEIFWTRPLQWQIQDFAEEGAPTPQGAPKYGFANFSQKLHEIERIWTGGAFSPLDPPLPSLN